ncbi:hypothetical protein AWQ22_12845 [Picosynechococcus sp. PCC 7117]|nr:hypothetical protein AWQ22_12845 [Picosynechococcus sp. PCC 7117]
MIFITGDSKEDWWIRNNEKIVGPHTELRKEFHEEVGQLFWMYRTQRFLELAKEKLSININDSSISEIENIENSQLQEKKSALLYSDREADYNLPGLDFLKPNNWLGSRSFADIERANKSVNKILESFQLSQKNIKGLQPTQEVLEALGLFNSDQKVLESLNSTQKAIEKTLKLSLLSEKLQQSLAYYQNLEDQQKKILKQIVLLDLQSSLNGPITAIRNHPDPGQISQDNLSDD